jgi:outer membrane protein TolC
MQRLFLMLLLACLGLCGCVAYHEQPLPDDEALLSDLTMVRDGYQQTLAFDLSDGVDIDEAAVIAVVNNPGLRALRAGYGVADAQVFAAGLFPDPQISLGSDKPTNQTDTQVRAFSLGIGYDLGAVLTRNPTQAAATAAAEQVRLDVVWQEWQVAQQVRIAATRYRTQARKLEVLRTARDRFAARAEASMKALGEGDLTVDVAGTDLSALLDGGSRLYQLELQHSDTAHELNGLLGLRPEVALPLIGADTAPEMPADIDVAAIEERRPDLLALRAGYESQEARVRLAVWHQFPALTVTWNRARDTGSVWTTGFNAALNLPLFTGARGEIAVEKATREKLHAEYLDRLAQTRSDVSRLAADAQIAEARLVDLRARLPELERMADQARLGYTVGELAAFVSINLDSALVTNKIELIDLEQTLWETRIALDTLLARESP